MSPTDECQAWIDAGVAKQKRVKQLESDLSATREEIELLRARLEPFAEYARLWANWKPGQMEAKPERPFIEYYIMADEALRSSRTKDSAS